MDIIGQTQQLTTRSNAIHISPSRVESSRVVSIPFYYRIFMAGNVGAQQGYKQSHCLKVFINTIEQM